MSFENDDGWESHRQYYLPTAEINDYNVMVDQGNFFDGTIINNLKTYDNIRKITTGQGDDCTAGCLLDNPYFKELYKLIAIDVSKQQRVDADPKPVQQVNFTGNLDWARKS